MPLKIITDASAEDQVDLPGLRQTDPYFTITAVLDPLSIPGVKNADNQAEAAEYARRYFENDASPLDVTIYVGPPEN